MVTKNVIQNPPAFGWLSLVLKKFDDIAIVYVTSYSDQDTLTKAKETKPHGYLLKPIDDRQLMTTIDFAINHCKLEKKINKAQKALRKSERKYRRLMENTQEAMIIAMESKICFVNEKMLEISHFACS